MDSFLLNVKRMTSSDLAVLANGDEFKAAILLWCRAWKQVPAGSLPDDDRVLAAFSGAGVKWRKVKAMALRGFVKCLDGRLYHPVLCDAVNVAWEAKKKNRKRTAPATEARKKQRNDERNDERDVDRNVDRNDERDVDRNVDRNVPQDKEEKKEEERDNESSLSSTAVPDTAQPQAASPHVSHPRYREVVAKVQVLLNSPSLTYFGRVDAWLKAGADPDLDIYPALERLKLKWRGPSLDYFDGPVADALATRTRPLPAGQPRPGAPAPAQMFDEAGLSPTDRKIVSRYRQWQKDGFWLSDWGPAPDDPRFDMPAWLKEKAA